MPRYPNTSKYNHNRGMIGGGGEEERREVWLIVKGGWGWGADEWVAGTNSARIG